MQEYSVVDKRVRLLSNAYDKGISGALNTGLDNCTGQYIAYLDHDDIAYPTRLERQYHFMEINRNIGVCGTWMQEFGEGTNRWTFPEDDADIRAISILHSPIANPTAMIRHSVIQSHHIRYKSDFDIAQDYEFWLQLLPHCSFANIPEVLVNYRIHVNNATKIHAEKQYQSWKKALTKYLEPLDINLEDFELRLLYDIKYPNFNSIYKDRKNDVDRLLTKIFEGNAKVLLYPHASLKKLFETKIVSWSQ